MKACELKERIQPEDFYTRELGVPIRPRARKWVSALCVFHPDRRRGNFGVNTETGAFKCFACGAAGGDILDFLQLRYSCSFTDAIERLRREYY